MRQHELNEELKEKIYAQHGLDGYVERVFEIAYNLPEEELRNIYYACFPEIRNYRYKEEAVNLFALFQSFVLLRIKEKDKNPILL